MTLSHTQLRALDTHLQHRLYNHQWLSRIENSSVNKVQARFFPYTADDRSSAKGRLVGAVWQSDQDAAELEDAAANHPRYLGMVPCYAPDNLDLSSLTTKIADEAFGRSSRESHEQCGGRFGLVVGLNRMQSLDPQRNRRFRRLVRRSQPGDAYPVQIIGRLWAGAWVKRTGFGTKTYSKSKAFLMVKAVCPEKAEPLRKKVEAVFGSQVPYVSLREWIKNSEQAAELDENLRGDADQPVYAAMLDADTLKLRPRGGRGLFSQYDVMVRDFQADHGELPQLLSTGYGIEQREKPVLRLAVRVDMAVRTAMASVDGLQLAPYYPEPNTLFLLEDEGSLQRWSFSGKGETCESLRLIQNARQAGLLQPNRAIFKSAPGLTTSTPHRMRFETHNQIGAVDKAKLGQLRVLKALRGPSQTHWFPKRWAEQLYSALSVKAACVTDVTKPLMSLLGVFNPQNIATSYLKTEKGRYSAKRFGEVLALHADFARGVEAVLLGRQVQDAALVEFLQGRGTLRQQRRAQLRGLFEASVLTGQRALRDLESQDMSEAERLMCVRAAAASGRTVVNILSSVD